ncbi:MAG: ribonuclease J [bacterium]|nr:ribonuclease J [Mycoplasmatota bacterium]MDD6756819.1 ribonuclease J [bacterium]MDY2908261.1 ribonuclease J [Candidatus Faecimonas sp.]
MEKPNGTKIVVLGGLGEVGKNMYCVMHNDAIVIIDTGVSFPESELMGVDYVLPDFTFLKQNEDKIKALLITHGHEDHIGGIPFLLQSLNIPAIYAPNHAKELIAVKLQDKNIRYDNLFVYTEDTKLKFKEIEIEFFRVTHSIPDSHGISIKTPDGRIVTTGDYKFDLTPIGPMANLYKMASLGEDGVDLFIGDSTNALNEGFSTSESVVDETLGEMFDKCKTNRIIIATFASNIYRIKHIFETCYKHNRKICIFGRSMENNINISLNAGYINHKELLVTPEEANNLKPGEVAILCTGSQGEPLAALSRISNGTHKQIKLRPDDVVIFSSSAIPGNALSITKTINKLCLKGVKVYTNSSLADLHTSGHANEEEIKLAIRLFKPKYLMPFHGDYRMLKRQADIGINCGIPKENTFILKNGDSLILKDHVITKGESMPGADVYVDGNRIGEIGSAVIKDRKIMANDGILVVIVNVNMKKRELLIKPNITTRGFVLVNENEELIHKIEDKAETIIKSELTNPKTTFQSLKSDITEELYPFINNLTGRKPIILPIILDIKKEK